MNRSNLPELVAVSKFQSLESMLAVYEEGQKIFGENYVQELIDKKHKLVGLGLLDVQLHFIGHLQTNKVKLILPHVAVIHSIDSLKLLEKVNAEAKALNREIGCYFQVNIDEEETKGGFRLLELESLAKQMIQFTQIVPLGLMCIPDPQRNVAYAFRKLKEYSNEYRMELGSGLSMGMSDDFELAIECGATSLRIGSAIFGARPARSI